MAIIVNKVQITDVEIGQEMQYHPAPSQQQAWHNAAQALVIRQLLLQQAASNGLCGDMETITPFEQEEELINQLLEREVSVPEADEATCQRFYDSHSASFTDKKTGECLTFEQVHANIRDYLHTKAMRIAVAEYIKALSYGAEVKGFELDNL